MWAAHRCTYNAMILLHVETMCITILIVWWVGHLSPSDDLAVSIFALYTCTYIVLVGMFVLALLVVWIGFKD